MLIDEMDEIFGLTIQLDRQITQRNFKQAYAIAKMLSVKLATLMDKILLEAMEMMNNDEP